MGASPTSGPGSSPAPAQQFLRRIAVLLCGTFGAALLAFGTQLILTRGMSVSDYGRLAALLAAINVLTPVAMLGMGWFWLELFGREGLRATRWLGPALRLGALASLASVVLLLAYVAGTSRVQGASTVLVALLVIPILLGQSLAETTAVRFQLEERYVALTGWQSLTPLGRALVAVGLLAVGTLHTEDVLAGYAMVGALAIVISLVSINRVRHGRIRLAGHDAAAQSATGAPAPSLKEVLRAAAPYCLGTMFFFAYTQGIVALVNSLLGSEAAGIYNVAFLITAAIYLIPNVVYMKYLAGKLFRWWVHDRAMFSSAFHLGVASHLLMGLLGAAVVAGTAAFLIPALFGSRYAAAVPVLSILALGIPIRFVQHAYGSALFSREHIHRKLRYMGCAAAASVVLTLILTPAFGLAGAAASAVLSELLLLALFVYGVVRHVAGIDVLATFRYSTLSSSFAYVSGRGVGPVAEQDS